MAAQIGGRMLDRVGAKAPVVAGSTLAAVGFFIWAGKVTQLDLGKQVWVIVMTGAGMGLMLGQANTDAVNRASRLSYGEATGITQTVRNYAASLGLAVLGTSLVTVMRNRVTDSLLAQGAPRAQAAKIAASIAQGGTGSARSAIPAFVRLDFAYGTRSVLITMGAAMTAAAVTAPCLGCAAAYSSRLLRRRRREPRSTANSSPARCTTDELRRHMRIRPGGSGTYPEVSRAYTTAYREMVRLAGEDLEASD